jgi:hypothetical protein
MSIENYGHEHEFEPQFGLPERLPQDERIVWQTSPNAAALAREAFQFRKLALYFAVLWVAKATPDVTAGNGLMAVVLSLKWLAPLTVIALASVWALAWMTARTTVYTLTNKRLVMRLGIVLTVTFNLPLKKIIAADLRQKARGFGDISLALGEDDHIAMVHLWPSARPWHFARPQPTVRCVANAKVLAEQLSEVWSAETGLAAKPAAPVPVANTSGQAPAHLQTRTV